MSEIPAEIPVDKKDRIWAMFCHLTGLALFIGIPFGNIIGPLIIWIIKKDEFPLVDQHGKESINFQISMTVYALISLALVFVFIGFALLFALLIIDLILVVKGIVKANEGQPFRYPITIRFIQ